jgi:hypothetical protein
MGPYQATPLDPGTVLTEVLVTMEVPAGVVPPRTAVTQVGSPANRALYSGVRSCLQQEEQTATQQHLV